MKKRKKILYMVKRGAALVLAAVLLWKSSVPVLAEEEFAEEIDAVSAVLMEAETGTVILEKQADEPLPPASITKIMTLLLIFEALEQGKIQLTDEVVTSAHAKSMGGSQVYLEEGEIQTAETMIKCIVIASGNDASVAMAEHIAGSEEEFVRRMNQKAKELGMTHTNFEDCCGLTDSPSHVSSAKDVAVMSRELITRYPEIYEYSTIWMENITHVTRQGEKEFCLANTNKLLKTYEGAKGLKTGSTSIAKYCLSATAVRNDIHLIAVIMAAPDYKARFREAEKLLDYGYANCTLYKEDWKDTKIPDIPVKKSLDQTISGTPESTFQYVCFGGTDPGEIQRDIQMEDTLTAPVVQGQQIGQIVYMLDGNVIGKVAVTADHDVEKSGFLDYFFFCLKDLIG